MTTIVLFSLSNMLYAVLNVFGSAGLAVMIVSRFLVGFSAGDMLLQITLEPHSHNTSLVIVIIWYRVHKDSNYMLH